jgi:hypothetical protein
MVSAAGALDDETRCIADDRTANGIARESDRRRADIVGGAAPRVLLFQLLDTDCARSRKRGSNLAKVRRPHDHASRIR